MPRSLAAEQIDECRKYLAAGQAPPVWLIAAVTETAVLGLPAAEQAELLRPQWKDREWMQKEDAAKRAGISKTKNAERIVSEDSWGKCISVEGVRKAIQRARKREPDRIRDMVRAWMNSGQP